MGEQLFLPGTMEELHMILNEADESYTFISGGTDMILDLKENGYNGRNLIDLSGIEALKFIEKDDQIIRIGAGTTLSTIIDNTEIKALAPMLAKAADCVGSTQIRNAATIGGNVANAFAGADLIPPLIALDARLILLGKNQGERVLGISDFLLGNRKNALEVGEMVKAVEFNIKDSIQYFGKIGSRSRVTISKLNMAVSLEVKDMKINGAKVVFGALGRTAFSSELIESYLVDKEIKDISNDSLVPVFIQQVDEAIPGRASRVYKRDAVTSLCKELTDCISMEG